VKASAQLFELQKLVGPNAKGAQKILQLLQRGLALQQSGKLKEAEYCFQLVLRDNPDHPEALNLLGTLASKAKNHVIAIECLTKAVGAQPANVYYRNNLGFCLNSARRAREAIPHFEKAIGLDPQMAEPLMGLAHSHRLLGEGEEAEKAFRRALLLTPDNNRLKSLVGEVLIDLGRISSGNVIVVFHRRRSRRSYAKRKRTPRPELKYFLFHDCLLQGHAAGPSDSMGHKYLFTTAGRPDWPIPRTE